MAKDGTMRGGARIGAGKKPKSLVDKIAEGIPAEVMELPRPSEDLEGEDVPEVKEYLKAKQKNGKVLLAENIYKETYLWLKARGCETLVSSQLIENYAMSMARQIQCEEAINEYGMLAKHPTTNLPIASPFVSMAQNYMKQATIAWNQIYQVVRENCSTEWQGSPNDDMMERLLRSKR